MNTDRRTIGVTAQGERTLEALVAAGNFGTEMEAAKFALAYAARTGGEPPAAEGATTKWNVGTFDADGSLRAVLEALNPECKEPVRLIEQLIEQGLILLDPGDGLAPDVAGALLDNGTVEDKDAQS